MWIRCYILRGQYDKAFDETQRLRQMDPGDSVLETHMLGQIYAAMGRQDDVRKCIRQRYQEVGKGVVDPMWLAMMYASLGEKDSAFAYLDKLYREHSLGISYVKLTPEFDSLHSDRRYTELLRKAGFSE
jgi:predicted Zn-dependent protease